LTVLLACSSVLFAESHFPVSYQPDRQYTGQTIWELPDIPEEQLDIGLWALIIAKEYDSAVDVQRYLDTLDAMSVEIERMVGGRNTDMVKFVMTKMCMFDPGEWNNNHPFEYDLDDPFGQKTENRLLSTYIDTRKGNCVSMPTLFLALMERVDPNIPFHGVAAPLHLFCRFHERETGEIWSVEPTNGGNSGRDEWYIEQMNIPKLGIDSGIYMSDLTKREFLAELIAGLVSAVRQEGKYDEAMEYTDLMLKLNPRSVTGLVHKGALLSWKGQILLDSIVAEKRQPSLIEHERLSLYQIKSDKYIERAKSFGWSLESPRMRKNYLRTIEEERSNSNN